MPGGPGVGDIILQAAQGIVAMHQRRQQLALQQQQLQQESTAQREAAKARDEGLKIREENLRLQQEQHALTKQRFETETRLSEEAAKDTQARFEDTLKVSQTNARVAVINALRAVQGADGKIDLEKAAREAEKETLGITRQRQLIAKDVAAQQDRLVGDIQAKRFQSVREGFLGDAKASQEAKTVLAAVKSHQQLSSELFKAQNEVFKWEGLREPGRADPPQLVAARRSLGVVQEVLSYVNNSNYGHVITPEEVAAEGRAQGLPPSFYDFSKNPHVLKSEITAPSVTPEIFDNAAANARATGNWDQLFDTLGPDFLDENGKVSVDAVTKLYQALEPDDEEAAALQRAINKRFYNGE